VKVGEAEEQGYADEYQLEDFEISAADYIKPQAVSNFRNAWEELDAESELVDDYDLGKRESLQVRHPLQHSAFFKFRHT
jgi:coatomer protein complex subunit gamma